MEPAIWNGSLYNTALQQLTETAEIIHLDPNILRRLSVPEKAVLVSVAARMDSGEVRVFSGNRVYHNNTLGPYKGGVRFHPEVSLSECGGLAMLMSWKCALAGLPLGGAKGGIAIHPKEFTRAELERITRRYTSELINMIGPERDIPAPDMGTDEQIMAWMMDTYSQQVGQASPGVVTGKPIAIGGSVGRHEATGKGVIYTVTTAAKKLDMSLNKDTRFVIQGFGNVGAMAGKAINRMGCTIVGVSTSKGGVYNPKGLPLESLYECYRKNGSFECYNGGDQVTNEELLELPCEVLIPAATSGQIGKHNADKLRCRILAEGANGPTTPEGDAILADRGVFVIPDIVANAGGVLVSYFEWVQDLQYFFWDEDEIDRQLRRMLETAFTEVYDLAQNKGCDMRRAALIKALGKISQAMLTRGLFP